MGMLESWYGPDKAKRMKRARSSNFGDAASDLLSAKEQFAQRLVAVTQALRKMADTAIAKVNTNVFITSTTRTNYISALKNVRDNVIPLRERSMQEVLAGTLPVEKWLTACKAVETGIADIYKGIGEDSLIANFSAVINGITSDVTAIATTISDLTRAVGRVAQKLPEVIDKNSKLLVFGGLGLAAFIFYQYATAGLRFLPSRQPRLSGYNRRRRQ